MSFYDNAHTTLMECTPIIIRIVNDNTLEPIPRVFCHEQILFVEKLYGGAKYPVGRGAPLGFYESYLLIGNAADELLELPTRIFLSSGEVVYSDTDAYDFRGQVKVIRKYAPEVLHESKEHTLATKQRIVLNVSPSRVYDLFENENVDDLPSGTKRFQCNEIGSFSALWHQYSDPEDPDCQTCTMITADGRHLDVENSILDFEDKPVNLVFYPEGAEL